MTHPNSDFIKKFLGEQTEAPKINPTILQKQKQYEYDALLKNFLMKNRIDLYNESLTKREIKPQTPTITESIKFLTERISNYAEITKVKLPTPRSAKSLNEQREAGWVPQLLAQGLYYYNTKTGQWMNTFGIIKNSLDEFLVTFDESGDDGRPIAINPEPPPQPIVYDNGMTMFRFIDSDIYGFVVERNPDPFAIDNYYPEYPYTGDRTLTNFGDLFEFLNVMSDLTTWDSGLAGRVFLGGALGKKADSSGAGQYGETGSDERIWSENWAELSTSGNQTASFYDIADTARRGVGSGFTKPSTLSKYQWFDFTENKVKGAIKQSIAAGYGGSTVIETGLFKVNVPRTGYTTNADTTAAQYSLIIANPTPVEIAAKNPNLVSVNAQGITYAQVRELFSNDLDGNSVDDVENPVRFVSIDQSVDMTIATLDENGSIRILFSSDASAEANASRGKEWQWLTYFDKEWIGEGFLTDEDGNAVFIENENFVSVTATNGLGNSLVYVWCLHESGRLYGVELTTAVDSTGGVYRKREKFITPGDPSSGRNPNFGKVPSPPTPAAPPSTTMPDEFRQYYTWSGNNVTAAVDNGTCKEIAYVLNLIPKIDGVRFPVTSVFGGYHSGGVLTCIDPRYTGYLPTQNDNFNHPAQMCEIVKLQKINTFDVQTERLLSKVQRYVATYDTNTETWSYSENPNLDQQLYDTIFGVTLEVNGTNQLVYVPPRCVSIQRLTRNGGASSPSSQAAGIIHILSNNGTWTPIAGQDVYVPCKFDLATNPNFVDEITEENRLTMKGSFTLGYEEWGYTAWGASPIFNAFLNYFVGSYYKFGFGPTPFTSPAPAGACMATFDQATMWSTFFYRGAFPQGWGNPPRIDGVLMPQYGIPAMDENADDLFGFSFHDYFGNTGYESPPPAYALLQNNYINDTAITTTIAYGDTAGNYPVFLNGQANTGYVFFANTISVLSIADEEVLDNPFAWIRGVGDSTFGVRFDGSIDIIDHRGADDDGFVFDPFWGPSYPEGRLNPAGVTFSSLKPANYNDIINSMKKVGKYIPGVYQTYNHYLPDL